MRLIPPSPPPRPLPPHAYRRPGTDTLVTFAPAAAESTRCKDAKGTFVQCETPEAKPA